ncbi:MAG: sigma-70 family RNA polymerase sigma factor [candidate division Zixibacteria bacterium]|nr:sigma-70 family RNA polymerase sigma factor [candidate division Zixibacteria bacterium]
MSEKELLTKAKAGDFEAFLSLVDAHKGKVYAMVRRLTQNKQDAEDIMQDTLLKAIDKIDQFRGDSSFGTWLYTIALNFARGRFAQKSQADLKPIEEYLPGLTDSGSHNHEQSALFDWRDPHKQLETEQLKKIIDEAINELPYKYREAFILRYVEELSVKEVARLTKQSDASAKSRILRARLALRDRLAKTFEDEYGRKVS